MYAFLHFHHSILAQEQRDAKERILEFANSAGSISELARIGGSRGLDKITADDLALVLTKRGNEIFGGEENEGKFWAALELCEMIVSSTEGGKLVPQLVDLMKKLEPKVPKPPSERDWNEILFESRGGRLGLLMNCILDISGPSGFNRLYAQLKSAGRADKVQILAQQLCMRRDAMRYLSSLRERSASETNQELKTHLEQVIAKLSENKEGR